MPEKSPHSPHSKRGFWSRLFGSRNISSEKVIEENINRLVAEGKAKEITDEMVCVNLLYDSLLDSAGSDDPMTLFESMTGGFVDRQEFWRIGVDISTDVHGEFVDSDSGELYGVSRLKDGKKQTQLMKKELWELTKNQMDLS